MTPFTAKLTTEDGNFLDNVEGYIQYHDNGRVASWTGTFTTSSPLVSSGHRFLLDIDGDRHLRIDAKSVGASSGRVGTTVEFMSNGRPLR